jgi:hypothetical protein
VTVVTLSASNTLVQNTQTIEIAATQLTCPDGVLKDVTVAPHRYTSSEAPEECRARTTGKPPLPASVPGADSAAIPVSRGLCVATILQRSRLLSACSKGVGRMLTLVPAMDTECFAHSSVNHVLSALAAVSLHLPHTSHGVPDCSTAKPTATAWAFVQLPWLSDVASRRFPDPGSALRGEQLSLSAVPRYCFCGVFSRSVAAS